ncbi:hypothetical protein AB1Y20_019482 [Prymnesium parvum]|uniref:Solute carrier family 40 protein n=1 Tax=Prymnesium parvum TaxID=97485 RepID=A0AB34JUK7_PRYPA
MAVGHAWATTLRLVARFFSERTLRVPVLVVAVATLGGSLHAPVISYFYLQLKLTAPEIGSLGAISSVGTMLLSPLYGWLLDTHGAYYAILFSSSMCALGCLARGCAAGYNALVGASLLLGLGGGNLITLVCAYLSSHTARAERAAVLSAYISLLSVLNISGKSLYVPFDDLLWALGVTDLMVRYRITISVCTFFCFFGVAQLFCNGAVLRRTGQAEGKGASDDDVAMESEMRDTVGDAILSEEKSGVAPRRPCAAAVPAEIVLVMLGLWLRTASLTLTRTLWPLWLKFHFGWGAGAYSRLLLASSLLDTTAVACFPTVERRCGRTRTACLLAVGAAFGALGFTAQLPVSGGTQAVHTVLVIAHLACIATLEPSLKSVASLRASQEQQGRSFGAMALICGLGDLFANLVGTRVFQASLEGHIPIFNGGAFPFVILSGLIAIVVSILHFGSATVSAQLPESPRLRCSPSENLVISDSDSERGALTRGRNVS